MLPNQAHGVGIMSNYMMRHLWDYFVKYLAGAEPPKEYEIKTMARPVFCMALLASHAGFPCA